MVPPPKPATPPVRTPVPAPPRARPLAAFQTLLLNAGGPKPRLAVRSLEPRAPDPTKSVTVTVAAKHAPKPSVDDDRHEKPKTKTAKPADTESLALDPSTRMSAQLAPPIASTSVNASEAVATRTRVSLEELVPQVLRRIAWGGDRTKGSVHLELMTGEKVTVHAAAGGRRVRVEVEGNDDLERRLGSRLRAAGIEVEGVG